MPLLLIEFDAFPKAKEGVGTILASYGEIEFALLGILSDTLFDGESANALRVLFRIRGEGARIDVCDGLVSKKLQKKWVLVPSGTPPLVLLVTARRYGTTMPTAIGR
jgi:hypothetical protein